MTDTMNPLQEADPTTVRATTKPEHAMALLRDINRCSVRPDALIAHQGRTVLVTDTGGRIGAGYQGFYLHQTRFLSRLQVRINDEDPKLASANVVAHHFITAYHLAPSPAARAAQPDGEDEDASASEIVKKAIAVQLNLFTGNGLHCDLVVTNHGLAPADITITLDLGADFADYNEALAGKRQQTALVERRWMPSETGGVLQFRYLHPKLDLASRITLGAAGEVVDLGHALACRLILPPQSPHLLTLDLSPDMLGKTHLPFYGIDGTFAADATPAMARRHWSDSCQRIEAANPVVQSAWEQAVSDLASLQLLEGPDAQPFMITAGMPNYSGLFGRDAYITALQTATLSPDTLRGALQVLTPLNATETNDELDAEPGKVLHQRQLGPLSQLGLDPFLHYYGDASAPGLFLLAAATDLAHTGDTAFFRSLRQPLLQTLAWMAHNQDSAGFHPYQTRSRNGVKNQSWKDSGEAVLYPDGSMVKAPIAMADIQGLFYAGKQALGLAFLETGDEALGARLLQETAALKTRFNQAFWMPDERYFAIALDARHHQVKSIASDPGACLAFGIIDDAHVADVARRLLAPDLFSGWGIRTLSADHPAYNPFAYHLGTVWPSPDAVTAFGLRRYGFDRALFTVAEGQFAASQLFDLDRLPEVFGGNPRDARHPHPGLYPAACSPQAWSAGAVILLVNTMLGLMPVAPRGTLVVDPVLPDWLPELTVRNIRVGDRRAALRAWRDSEGATQLDVLEAGGLVIVRPSPATLSAGQDRVAARVRLAQDPRSGHILSP